MADRLDAFTAEAAVNRFGWWRLCRCGKPHVRFLDIERSRRLLQSVKKRVEKIESSRFIDTQRQLQEAVHDLEWRSRQLNLEFHGIPVTKNAHLLEKN